MVRARIFLALAFLAATFVAAAMIPDTGNAAASGCADPVCTDVAADAGCPGCKGEGPRSADVGATACAATCAAMTGVLTAAPQGMPAAPRTTDGRARVVPGGMAVAPERAPPRPSIPA